MIAYPSAREPSQARRRLAGRAHETLGADPQRRGGPPPAQDLRRVQALRAL